MCARVSWELLDWDEAAAGSPAVDGGHGTAEYHRYFGCRQARLAVCHMSRLAQLAAARKRAPHVILRNPWPVCILAHMTANVADAGMQIPVFTRGDRMRKARENAGLSQQELADAIGISRRSISAYEAAGTLKKPVLLSWSLACRVPLVWLTDGDLGTSAQTVNFGCKSRTTLPVRRERRKRPRISGVPRRRREDYLIGLPRVVGL